MAKLTTVNFEEGGLMEYFFVAVPPEPVNSQVAQLKAKFADEYGSRYAHLHEPGILLGNFLAAESMEGTIIRWVHRICSQFQAFEVTLNNYSGIPSHTIFLRVQDCRPFQTLADQLKVIDQYVQSSGFSEVRFFSRPHLAIAEDLEPAVYMKAMLDYSARLFHERFLISELLLLKRKNRFETSRQVNLFRLYPPDANIAHHVAQLLKESN